MSYPNQWRYFWLNRSSEIKCLRNLGSPLLPQLSFTIVSTVSQNSLPWVPGDAAALFEEFFLSSQVAQLATLINMLIGELSKGDRQKIMTICTIDVHARDVVSKLIQQKVENAQAFLWLSQLRHRWDDQSSHCFANICDAQFKYSYEYLGNTPRLVITPLTDR